MLIVFMIFLVRDLSFKNFIGHLYALVRHNYRFNLFYSSGLLISYLFKNNSQHCWQYNKQQYKCY